MNETENNQRLFYQPFSLRVKIGFVFLAGILLFVAPTFHFVFLHPERSQFLLLGLAVVLISVIFFTLYEKRLTEKGDIDKMSFFFRFRTLWNVCLLSVIILFFDRINSPLFLFYLPILLQSSFSQEKTFVRRVMMVIASFTTIEFVCLAAVGKLDASPFTYVYFIGRLTVLFLIGSYGDLLVTSFRNEKQAREETRRAVERLESVTKNLKITNTKLEDLSKLKDEFVSVASHELRAPMTTIKGYLSMILDGDVGEAPPKVLEYLKSAYESSERMIRLVNNMLNVSRIESGRLIMSLTDIQMEEAIEDVVRSFSLEAENHGLELKFFPPRKKLPRVRLDPDRIREVIANLVGNSINFTSHGYIHLRSELEDGSIIVSVEDTGVGIAPEDQHQLFKKFSQVGVGAPLKKGSGLGLYICKMLINEFGGDIWLKSKVGKGTTFYFNLPAIVNRNEEAD